MASALSDISEKLLELGVSGAKKTIKPISYIANTGKEQITGKYNYTPLNSPDVMKRLQGNYDQGKLDKARNTIANQQAPNPDVQKVQEKLNFFNKYIQEGEQLQANKKNEEQEKDRAEAQNLEKQKEEAEQSRRAQQQQEEPQGKVRQSVLAPRKKRKSFETKANGGK